MTHPSRPELPLPPPLRGADPDSFARRTVLERLPRIGRRVLAEHDYPSPVAKRLRALVEGIPDEEVRLLHDTTAADAEQWVGYVAPHIDEDWLQVPWFFAETYFYRRILEATGYYEKGPDHRVDPFAPHKAQSREQSWAEIERLARRLAGWRDGDGGKQTGEILSRLLAISLWGNQGDLSMWPEGAAEQPDRPGGSAAEHILVDDSAAAVAYLQGLQQGERGAPVRVAFLMDNAGLELAADLALVDFLLDSGLADFVTLYVKSYPLFVSDAMEHDVQEMIAALAGAEEAAARTWAAHLRRHREGGHVRLVEHPFWNSPLPGWQMPPALYRLLGEADLVISKGDAAYRRLLGDRHWPYSTPLEEIVSYFPAPLLILRTLKSEVAAGIPEALVERLNREHPDWTYSGLWGVIQFVPL